MRHADQRNAREDNARLRTQSRDSRRYEQITEVGSQTGRDSVGPYTVEQWTTGPAGFYVVGLVEGALVWLDSFRSLEVADMAYEGAVSAIESDYGPRIA